VNVDRVIAFDVTHQVEIPFEGNVWIVAALDQNLDAAERLQLLDFGTDLLKRKSVAFVVLWPPGECAKPAVSYTYVGVVDVPVDNVSDSIPRMLFLAYTIRGCSELEKGRVRVEVEEL